MERYGPKVAPNRSEPYPDPKCCKDLNGYIIYHISRVLFPSNLDHGLQRLGPKRPLLPFQDFAALSKPPALVNPLLGGPG